MVITGDSVASKRAGKPEVPSVKAQVNPPFTEEEDILVLELYFLTDRSRRTSKKDLKLIALSEFLNSTNIHSKSNRRAVFRNQNGIYMKLMNFRSLDPEVSGKGLTSASEMDKRVWRKYSGDIDSLKKDASNIRENYASSGDSGQALSVRKQRTILAIEYNQIDDSDVRKRSQGAVVLRPDQANFREDIISVYKRSCALTGCDVIEACHAIHIDPYNGSNSVVQNGILLRADVHRLFDCGLITIEPDSFKVCISKRLASTSYSSLDGVTLALPHDKRYRPSKKALKRHYEWATEEPSWG